MNTPENQDGWVVCPFEPGLKLPVNKLEAHIKVCPRANQLKVVQSLPYYNLDVNLLDKNPSAITDDKIEFSLDKIHQLYKKMADKYQSEFPDLFHVYDQVKHIEDAGEKFTHSLKHSN